MPRLVHGTDGGQTYMNQNDLNFVRVGHQTRAGLFLYGFSCGARHCCAVSATFLIQYLQDIIVSSLRFSFVGPILRRLICVRACVV